MRSTKVLQFTVYALFMAIMLVMGLVPGLGFIPTPVAGIVIIQVPVILASFFLGYKGGILFGLVFGVTSVINCFIQPDVFAGIILGAGNFGTIILLMVLCLVFPRVMIGITTRVIYNLASKFDKSKFLSMGLAAFTGTITNTVLFLGAFYVFAKEPCMASFGYETSGLLFKAMLGIVLSNGVIEAITSVILCTAIGQALYRFFFKRYPMDTKSQKNNKYKEIEA